MPRAGQDQLKDPIGSQTAKHISLTRIMNKETKIYMTKGLAKKISSIVIIICLGLIFPVYSMWQASLGINNLTKDIHYNTTLDDLTKKFIKIKKNMSNGNDYAFFSLLYTEHTNQKTMINKQITKSTIVQTGFAAISIGIMLILLGINDGGLDATTDTNSFKFNIKTGSSGIAIFTLGSIMILAGSLKNEYKTVPIPEYIFEATATKYYKSIASYKDCKSRSKNYKSCFVAQFEKINYEELK